jgi:hypothetical protein
VRRGNHPSMTSSSHSVLVVAFVLLLGLAMLLVAVYA